MTEPLVAYDGNGEPYEVMPREQSLARAREQLERLGGLQVLEHEPTDRGECQDCKRHAPMRWRYGRVEVCRRCLLWRMNAFQGEPERWLDVSEAAFTAEVDAPRRNRLWKRRRAA
jgi:hypothetical protein